MGMKDACKEHGGGGSLKISIHHRFHSNLLVTSVENLFFSQNKGLWLHLFLPSSSFPQRREKYNSFVPPLLGETSLPIMIAVILILQIALIKFNRIELNRIAELWVQLLSLLDNFYSIHSSLFFYQFILMILNCTISIYHVSMVVLPQLMNTDDILTQISLALYVTVTGWWSLGVYLYIETGYRVEKKVIL